MKLTTLHERLINEDTSRVADETRYYKITGRPHQLDELEHLLAWADHCGAIGHSGSAKLWIDGDGSARMKIVRDMEGEEAKLSLPDDYDSNNSDPELSIGID